MSIAISSQVLGTLSVTIAETTGTLSVSVLATAPAVLSMELGTPGPAATVTVGSTTTLSAGSSATVTNSGSSLAAILNFGIPQGEQGEPGPAGTSGIVYATAPLSYNSGTQTISIDLTDYATQAWVDSQGYLQAGALTGYATQSWVTSQGYLTSAPVTSVAGRTGAITLAVADVSGAAPLASPALTGTPTAPTATAGTNSTQLATTEFVQSAVISGSAHAETLQATVRNETGATLNPFTVVYINGASGNKATVAKAQANAESTSTGTFAVLETAILNNQNGTAIIAGVISGLNTLAYTEGASLWLSPSTAGGVTTTKPTAPNHAVFIGIVTRAHANQGTVEIRIINGYEIEELHNVSITSVANGDLLAYESSTTLWKNKSASTLGLETSAHAASTYQPIGSYLTDAPSDGTPYVRLNGAWEQLNIT